MSPMWKGCKLLNFKGNFTCIYTWTPLPLFSPPAPGKNLLENNLNHNLQSFPQFPLDSFLSAVEWSDVFFNHTVYNICIGLLMIVEFSPTTWKAKETGLSFFLCLPILCAAFCQYLKAEAWYSGDRFCTLLSSPGSFNQPGHHHQPHYHPHSSSTTSSSSSAVWKHEWKAIRKLRFSSFRQYMKNSKLWKQTTLPPSLVKVYILATSNPEL